MLLVFATAFTCAMLSLSYNLNRDSSPGIMTSKQK